MTFAALNTGPAISAYWWVEIEGLRKRYGTYLPSWNPADSGTNQHIEQLLVEPPRIGEQRIDPLNGSAEISQHSFSLLDSDDAITSLVSSANIGDKAVLTGRVPNTGISELVVDDYSDLPSSGHLFIDRETFYYSAKASPLVATGKLTTSSASATADAGSGTLKMIDAARTELNDYWTNGWIVFTSGAVSGERRKILRSTGSDPLSYPESAWAAIGGTEDANCIYWDTKNPLTGGSCSGCNYVLLYPPRKARCTSLATGLSSYWVGAVVTVVGDPTTPANIGESRFVTEWDDTNQVLTFNDSFIDSFDYSAAAAEFDITKYSLVCSDRALYGSRQEEHSVVDERGDFARVEVTTSPTYIKTRRVWIYENRTGCLEVDAKMRQGVLSDFTLDASMVCYSFSVDSIQRLLSQKMMASPWRGTLENGVWGGALAPVTTAMMPDGSGGSAVIGFYPVSDDGETNGFDYSRVRCFSQSYPAERGNLRINNELIHYRARKSFVPQRPGERSFNLILGETQEWEDHESDWLLRNTAAVWEQGVPSIDVQGFCVKARGLFSDKCGRKAVAKWGSKGSYYGTTSQLDGYWRAMVPEFMSSHDIGDETRAAMICDGTQISDMLQIDMLTVTGWTGTPVIGETVTGSATGATGIINDFSAAKNQVWILRPDDDTAERVEFMALEGLTSSGWTGSVEEIWFGNGIELPARNNPINAVLAILLSGAPTPHRYNYLPNGWGIGLLEDDVDIDGIEDLRDQFFSNSTVEFSINEPTSFAEWSEQMFRSLALFPYETTDGKISLGYLMTEAECSEIDDGFLVSIGSDSMDAQSAPGWTSGRMPITKLMIKYNKNPCEDDYLGKIEVNFSRSRGTSQDYGRTEEIECQQLYSHNNSFERVDPRSPEIPDSVARIINPLWGRHTMFPAPVITCSVPYSMDSEIDVGSIVKVTNSNIPNLRTGTRGLSDEYFQVVGKAPDVAQGICDLELWQIGIHDSKYGRSTPSAEVVGYAADTPTAGKSTITVEPYTYGVARHQEADCEHFVDGDVVCCLSAALDSLSSPVEMATVDYIGTNTIVLTSNLSTPPTAGCIVEIGDFDNALSTRRSSHVFLADENNRLGAGNSPAFRFH